MSSAVPGSVGRRLAVTGFDGAVGRAIAAAARARYGADEVVLALRGRSAGAPVPPTGATATVVHVALSTDLGLDMTMGTPARREALLESLASAVERAGEQGRLVVVGSARVCGAHDDNPVPLPEDAPRRAVDEGGDVGDLLLIEAEAERLARERPGLRLTLLRAAAVVGPGVDTTITRHFESPRLLRVRDGNPAWQFCHVDDLAAAVLVVLEHDLGPVVTVGAPGWLTQEDVERSVGKPPLDLPWVTALAIARRLAAVGTITTTGGDLDYVRHPWAVPATLLRAHGWSARHDNEACLRALLDELGGGRGVAAFRRDAAMGTASAAVAVVGTAALVRRHRRRGGTA